MSEASRIRDFMVKGSREEVSLATRKLALGALTAVVLRTPVDTGRARGNWQTSVGVAIGGGETGSLDKSGTSTITQGAASIGRQQGYTPIIIQNNVPYITRLNDGHSKQAPAGYVEGALASLGLGTGRG